MSIGFRLINAARRVATVAARKTPAAQPWASMLSHVAAVREGARVDAVIDRMVPSSLPSYLKRIKR
jgi:hypothetical protein